MTYLKVIMDFVDRTDDPGTLSRLFTMRLWYEPVDAGQSEVCMQAKHILTGETRYFRDWSLLAVYLTSKLHAPGDESDEQM